MTRQLPNPLDWAPVARGAAALLIAAGVMWFAGASIPDRPSAVARPSVELLSLRHARDGASLTVTGTVRVHGPSHAPVSAVVTALDAHGAVVARGRSVLDDAALDVDRESSFQVALPAQGAVERYVVRFEDPAGLRTHVDLRRTTADAARPQ